MDKLLWDVFSVERVRPNLRVTHLNDFAGNLLIHVACRSMVSQELIVAIADGSQSYPTNTDRETVLPIVCRVGAEPRMEQNAGPTWIHSVVVGNKT